MSKASNSDDRDRPQQMMSPTAKHLQTVTSHGTEHPWHESVSCRRFASMQVCCALAKPTMCDMERAKRIGRYFVGKPRARCWFRWQHSVELEAYPDADWGGDKATRRPVSAGVIMRGGHFLKVWTKKQQVVALSSAESDLYAAVKTASEGLGIQSVAKDFGISCGLDLHLNASATMCLVNRRGLGKAKHVDMQNLWTQEASKSGRFTTRKVGTNVNPADLMTKPLPKPKIEQLMNLMGCEFTGDAGTRRRIRDLGSKLAPWWRAQCKGTAAVAVMSAKAWCREHQREMLRVVLDS